LKESFEKVLFKALLKPYSQGAKIMVWKLLSDLVIMLHLLWIIFILFGFLVALKYFRVSFVHMAGLVFTLVLNLGGWYCPLTYLENYLHSLYDPQLHYAGPFITNNLQKLIYLELDEVYLRMGAIAWVGLNMGGYALLLRRILGLRAKSTVHSA
jgi:hypothetical protein